MKKWCRSVEIESLLCAFKKYTSNPTRICWNSSKMRFDKLCIRRGLQNDSIQIIGQCILIIVVQIKVWVDSIAPAHARWICTDKFLEKLNEIELEKLNEMWVRKTQRTSEAVKSAQMLKPTPFLVWDRPPNIKPKNKTQMQTPVSSPVTSRWDLLKFESPPLFRRACDSMISGEFF